MPLSSLSSKKAIAFLRELCEDVGMKIGSYKAGGACWIGIWWHWEKSYGGYAKHFTICLHGPYQRISYRLRKMP